MAWFETSTSSSITYHIKSDSMNNEWCSAKMNKSDQLLHKESKKLKYLSEPLGKVMAANIITGNVSLFAYRGSPVFKDSLTLGYSDILPYFDDPIISGYGPPTKLSTYNFSIIMDALEYLPGKMAKANLIKESLATLKNGSWNPFVLVLAKTHKMIEELAEGNKYEELRDGFLINKGPFKGLIVKGLDTEDLLELTHFARAKYVEVDTLIKTNLTCVRIYLNKQG